MHVDKDKIFLNEEMKYYNWKDLNMPKCDE